MSDQLEKDFHDISKQFSQESQEAVTINSQDLKIENKNEHQNKEASDAKLNELFNLRILSYVNVCLGNKNLVSFKTAHFNRLINIDS